jgi:hypothetical protein
MIEELKMSKNKRRRTSSNKTKYVMAVSLVALASLVTWSIIATNHPTAKPKASEYLQVIAMSGGSVGDYGPKNETVTIKILGLNITAIGGDARSIIVIVASQIEPEVGPSPPDYFLPQNQSWQAVILLQGLHSHVNDDGLFPVLVSIKCTETDPSDIWLYLKPEDIIATSGE